MPSANGFWAVCGESVLITCSSSGEKQLHRVLHAYVKYFNRARPHQGIRQQLPEQFGEPVPPDHGCGKVLSFPVMGGLHHDHRRSA
jgi:putative transposase